MDAVLETRDLTRSYGRGDDRFDALKCVSISVHSGESISIVGKSGSGKSTLMHLLALLDVPSSGSVLVRGTKVQLLRPVELNHLRNKEFGFVFQQFFLDPKASVLDNVILPLKIAGVGGTERKRRGLEVLDRLGLAGKAKRPAIELSGGQKQRVVIARAIVNEPSVIFADEPTGNLDSATGAEVEDMLFSLHRERAITLVVVTHDEELANRCERSIIIRDGAIDTKTGMAA